MFKKRERRKDILKHYTLKKGLGSIADGIIAANKFEVKFGAEVTKISKTDKGYTIKTEDGSFTSAALAMCCDVTAVPELMVDMAPKVADVVAKIKFQEIESFGVVVPSSSTEMKPFAGLVPTDEDFFSAVSRDTVPDDQYRGFTFHFKSEKLSGEEKLDKVCEVLGVKQLDIVASQEKKNIVPSLRLGHYDLVAELDDLLAGGSLYMGGNYFAGLAIEDCVTRSKAEVERMLKG